MDQAPFERITEFVWLVSSPALFLARQRPRELAFSYLENSDLSEVCFFADNILVLVQFTSSDRLLTFNEPRNAQ